MAVTEQGAISVVVDHDQVRAPPDGHGEARRQDELNAPFQGLGPVFCRSQWCSGPIKLIHPRAHVARTCHRFHWDPGCTIAPMAHPIPLRPARKRGARGESSRERLWLSREGPRRPILDEGAVAQFGYGLLKLRLRVHHDRSVPGDRFLDRFAGHEQEANALVACLHGDLVT